MGPLLQAFRQTAKYSALTLGSTVVSCALALQVEKSANRLFFYLVPHKYAEVDEAYGLTREQLDSVRHLRRTRNNSSNSTTSASQPTTIAAEAQIILSVDDSMQVSQLFSEQTVFASTAEEQPSSGVIRWRGDESLMEEEDVVGAAIAPPSTAAAARPKKTPIVLIPVNSIAACAMTG